MSQTNPIITIITVVKDDSNNLNETLDSIDEWAPRVEVIVKDALSKDGTVETARKYSSKGLRIVSCKDEGIYDGMNQAIQHANGSYLLFLNAGDTLLSGSLEIIFESLQSSNDLYKFLVETENGNARTERGGYLYFSRRMLNHQGIVYHRKNCFGGGCYDKKLKIIGDLRHLLEYKLWRRIRYVDKLIVRYKGDGIATRFISIGQNWRERMTVFRWKQLGTLMRVSVLFGAVIGYSFWWVRKVNRTLNAFFKLN